MRPVRVKDLTGTQAKTMFVDETQPVRALLPLVARRFNIAAHVVEYGVHPETTVTEEMMLEHPPGVISQPVSSRESRVQDSPLSAGALSSPSASASPPSSFLSSSSPPMPSPVFSSPIAQSAPPLSSPSLHAQPGLVPPTLPASTPPDRVRSLSSSSSSASLPPSPRLAPSPVFIPHPPIWLDLDTPLYKQLPRRVALIFRRRFHASDAEETAAFLHHKPSVTPPNPSAVHLLYLEAKRQVIAGEHVVPLETAVELAGLQLQITFQRYDPLVHVAGFLERERLGEFLPPAFRSLPLIEEDLYVEHRKHSQISEVEAKCRYLHLCSEVSGYAHHRYRVQLVSSARGLGGLAGAAGIVGMHARENDAFRAAVDHDASASEAPIVDAVIAIRPDALLTLQTDLQAVHSRVPVHLVTSVSVDGARGSWCIRKISSREQQRRRRLRRLQQQQQFQQEQQEQFERQLRSLQQRHRSSSLIKPSAAGDGLSRRRATVFASNSGMQESHTAPRRAPDPDPAVDDISAPIHVVFETPFAAQDWACTIATYQALDKSLQHERARSQAIERLKTKLKRGQSSESITM